MDFYLIPSCNLVRECVGGAAAASSTRPGRVYTVTTNEGTMIQIATEQTEIRIDDCVFVEEAGNTANIRHTRATACEPASVDVMSDADSDDTVDRAVRKVKLLCYD